MSRKRKRRPNGVPAMSWTQRLKRVFNIDIDT
jgi:hypothetical protein